MRDTRHSGLSVCISPFLSGDGTRWRFNSSGDDGRHVDYCEDNGSGSGISRVCDAVNRHLLADWRCRRMYETATDCFASKRNTPPFHNTHRNDKLVGIRRIWCFDDGELCGFRHFHDVRLTEWKIGFLNVFNLFSKTGSSWLCSKKWRVCMELWNRLFSMIRMIEAIEAFFLGTVSCVPVYF